MTTKTKILLDEKFINLVEDDIKTQTIRMNRRDYSLGDMVLVFDSCCIDTEITEIIYKRCGDLTKDDAAKDGVNSLMELFKVLKSFYPNIVDSSEITIVKFKRK